jgi:hypothetical protein
MDRPRRKDAEAPRVTRMSKYKEGDTAKLTNLGGYLNGLRVEVRAVSKTTGGVTVRLLEQPSGTAYRRGDDIHVMPYELKREGDNVSA